MCANSIHTLGDYPGQSQLYWNSFPSTKTRTYVIISESSPPDSSQTSSPALISVLTREIEPSRQFITPDHLPEGGSSTASVDHYSSLRRCLQGRSLWLLLMIEDGRPCAQEGGRDEVRGSMLVVDAFKCVGPSRVAE